MTTISSLIEEQKLEQYIGIGSEDFFLLVNEYRKAAIGAVKDEKAIPPTLTEPSFQLFLALAFTSAPQPAKEILELLEINQSEYLTWGTRFAQIVHLIDPGKLKSAIFSGYSEVLNYYQNRIDQLGGVAITADASISAAKSELRKKNNGLALLNTLQQSVDAKMSVPEIFETILKKLNISLRMDISAFMMPVAEDSAEFTIAFQFGTDYIPEANDTVVIEKMLNKPTDFLLVNKSTPENDFIAFIKEKIKLPFFIAVPVFSHGKLLGILVSGRLKELNPFFPSLDQSDVDLLKSISAFISVSCNNANLYQVLDQLVQDRTEEVVKQKEEIESKNEELEDLFKQVTDSIHYAKRIQEAILPPQVILDTLLPSAFVLFKPKDIVSGDFYFVDKRGDWVYYAAVDCTGHGVPGAFMSIVGYNLLKEALNSGSLPSPAEIMDRMNDGVASTFHHDKTDEKRKDGMDMTLCAVNFNTLELQYASAFNPLFLIRNNELIQYKGDKFPVGMYTEERQKFTNHSIQLQKGDSLYSFSDGYADQFGGPRGKKFLISNFRNLLLALSKEPIHTQKQTLDDTLENWKGDLEQIDDILVIGLKIE